MSSTAVLGRIPAEPVPDGNEKQAIFRLPDMVQLSHGQRMKLNAAFTGQGDRILYAEAYEDRLTVLVRQVDDLQNEAFIDFVNLQIYQVVCQARQVLDERARRIEFTTSTFFNERCRVYLEERITSNTELVAAAFVGSRFMVVHATDVAHWHNPQLREFLDRQVRDVARLGR